MGFDPPRCKTCASARTKKWYWQNRERALSASKEWVANNPERKKELDTRWYAEHHEQAKQSRAKYHLENPPDRIKVKATSAKWAAEHPEARRIREQNRRARKRKVGGGLSKGLIEKLFKLQKGKCPCCGLALGSNYHLDHVMPLALGGEHEDSNMQLLRQRCNNQKHAKHPIDFMQSRGFLL